MENLLKAGFVAKGLGDKIAQDVYEWGKGKTRLARFKNKEKAGEVYLDYLSKSKDKYSKVKTLLYKNEPKNLYDFYEPTTLMFNSNKIKEIIETGNSSRIFRKNNKVIIVGTGGIGKSFLMKHIFVNQIDQSESIPIFIDLKSMNSNENIDTLDLEEFIYSIVYNQGLSISKDEFSFTLNKGVYTILFDGFDEINNIHQNKFQTELIKISEKYHLNRYVVSSRPLDVFVGWETFIEYEVKKLSKEQSTNLIGRLDYDSNIKELFIKALNEKLYDSHGSFASIPLLLTVMLMTFEADANIPDDLTEFYNQAFYTLYLKHDASKSGYKRQLKAKLPAEKFKEIISFVAMQTFLRKEVEFDIEEVGLYLKKYNEVHKIGFKTSDFIYDAIHSACLLIQEGTTLYFTHRSFQEYFAGVGISKLPDDKQKKVLASWEAENVFALSLNKTFIETLVSLQRERTNINLFVPMIEKIEKGFKDCNEDMSRLIQKTLSFVTITKKDQIKILVSSKSEFPSIAELMRYTSGQPSYENPTEEIVNLGKQLKETIKEQRKKDKGKKISYSYALDGSQDLSQERARVALEYALVKFQYDFDALIDYKEKVKKRNSSKKRRLESILEDLI
ncbi:NACHT domain-containing protein [Lactococcus petauri]|uniref:NACHT domain-containing protein n=1 Tax=Lactococcus petauri TaxID=1940789 RepID=UPI0031FEE7E9